MSSSGGPIHGGRDVLDTVALPNDLTKSIVLVNIVGCPTLSCGLLKNSHRMVARCVGAVSFDRQDGIHTSFCGEFFVCDASVHNITHAFASCMMCCFSYRLSFAVYLLDIVVFIFDIPYGAYLMVILGSCMIIACLCFSLIIINETELVFPWTIPDCDGATQDCTIFLDPEFGWCFYLVLATGIAVTILGLLIYILHYLYPRHVASFFHHSTIEDDEIFLVGYIRHTLHVISSVLTIMFSLTLNSKRIHPLNKNQKTRKAMALYLVLAVSDVELPSIARPSASPSACPEETVTCLKNLASYLVD